MCNFKAWKDTGTIRMAPITLFFGTNSSGKSSIGHFLMMLKQTTESPDRRAVLYPGGRNTAVHLGSYQEMVYGRDPVRKIAFEYRWALRSPLKLRDPLSGNVYSGDQISFQAEVGPSAKDQRTLAVEYLTYRLWQGDAMRLAIGMERAGAKDEYKVSAESYDLRRGKGRPWNPGSPIRFYGFPEEVLSYYQNAGFVTDLNLQHELLFRSITYLGPLRTKPERLYSWTGIEPESVGYAGENTVAAFLAARGREISLGYRKRAKLFEEIIALTLQEMGLIDDFKISPISEQRQEYEVKVRVSPTMEWVDLPDVGFGVSQVLPVLVQVFCAPPGTIIIMEQPEIHLHPSAQAALADVMINVIRSRENGADRNIQLIIESHSEHFLRRLQRRIAEEESLHEEVAAYVVHAGSRAPKLEALEIDEYGNILNWPTNFFGDQMGEITGQAEAALNKRLRRRPTRGSGE